MNSRKGDDTTNKKTSGSIRRGRKLDAGQLTQMFKDCIQLSTQNKINIKNTWQLELIDHLDELLHKEEDFQVASATLDAGVKIYSSRVDSVHKETFKVLGDLTRSQTTKKKNDQQKEKKKGPRVGVATLTSDIKIFDTKKYDSTYTLDPIYSGYQSVDIGSAHSLLLNNLEVDDQYVLIIDGNDRHINGKRKEGEEDEELPTNVPMYMMSPMAQRQIKDRINEASQQISENEDKDRMDDDIEEEVIETPPTNGDLPEMKEEEVTEIISIPNMMAEEMNESISGTLSGAETSNVIILDQENFEEMVDGMEDGLKTEPANNSDDEGLYDADFDDDVMVSIPDNDDHQRPSEEADEDAEEQNNHSMKTRSKNGYSNEFQAYHSLLRNEDNEYRYFDIGDSTWAGRDKWKITTNHMPTISQNEKENTKKKKKKKKSKDVIDFSVINVAEELKISKSKSQHVMNAKTLCSKKNSTAILLPIDAHYKLEKLLRASTIDLLHVRKLKLKKIENNDSNTVVFEQDTLIQEDDAYDGNMMADDDMDVDIPDHDDLPDVQQDDDPPPLIVQPTSMSNYVSGISQQDVMKEEPEHSTLEMEAPAIDEQEAVEAPEALNSLKVTYAKSQHRINVRQLKEQIYKSIKSEKKPTPSPIQEPLMPNQSTTSFNTILHKVHGSNPSGSVGMNLICLLHLANEHGFLLDSSEDAKEIYVHANHIDLP